MLSFSPQKATRTQPTDLAVAVLVDVEDEGVGLLPGEWVAHLGEDCHQVSHVDGTGVALVKLLEEVLEIVHLSCMYQKVPDEKRWRGLAWV